MVNFVFRKSVIALMLLELVFWGCGGDELIKPKEGPKKVITWRKDGARMMLIPAGSFEMGDHFNDGEANELPVHKVELDTFYMDSQEVTVEQFRKFVDESSHKYSRWNEVEKYSPDDKHPMVYVTWNDAVAYCKWAGKRLPTEAEWEYAARGGLPGKQYPWGDRITHDYANYAGMGGKDPWDNPKDKWDSQTAPVRSFDPNGYGLYDMAGNISEWCADWYNSGYYGSSPTKNPKGPNSSPNGWLVLRGGSWLDDTKALRISSRSHRSPTSADTNYGFRCAADIP